MSDRFKNLLSKTLNNATEIIKIAEEIATEAEQLRKDKEAMERVLNGAKSLLQINSDAIDQLKKRIAELETFIQSRGIELP